MRPRRRATLLLLVGAVAVAALSSLHAAAKDYGTVDGVQWIGCYDGDTCTFSIPHWPAVIGERIDVRLRGIDTRSGAGSARRRATFYVTGMECSATGATGSAWEPTPWRTVQVAAWETLSRRLLSLLSYTNLMPFKHKTYKLM